MAAWLWPFLRIGACLMVAPVFGARFVPARFRILLAVAITLIVAPLLLAVSWLVGCATLNRPSDSPGVRRETSAAQPVVASSDDGTADVLDSPGTAQPLSSPPESDNAKSSDAANAERYLALRNTLTKADAARSSPAERSCRPSTTAPVGADRPIVQTGRLHLRERAAIAEEAARPRGRPGGSCGPP